MPKSQFVKRFQVGKNNINHSFGSPLRVVTTALLIFFASQLAAASLVAFALSLGGSGSRLSELNDQAFMQFSYVVLAEGFTAFLILRVLKNRGLSWKHIGLNRSIQISDIVRAVAGFIVFYGLLIGVGLLMALLVPEFKTDQPQDVGFNNLSSYLDQIMAFVTLVALVPIVEEILARGYLYSGLRSRMRFAPAMILTSIIFAVPHLFGGPQLVWGAAINTFVLSIVLVYLREKTGALYASIVVHALNNLVAFGVQFHSSML